MQSLEFFFDQDEPFLGHLQTAWQRMRYNPAAVTTWGLITQVTPINMRASPPVQLAICWLGRATARYQSEDILTYVLPYLGPLTQLSGP
jgi:hypothetical protein